MLVEGRSSLRESVISLEGCSRGVEELQHGMYLRERSSVKLSSLRSKESRRTTRVPHMVGTKRCRRRAREVDRDHSSDKPRSLASLSVEGLSLRTRARRLRS